MEDVHPTTVARTAAPGTAVALRACTVQLLDGYRRLRGAEAAAGADVSAADGQIQALLLAEAAIRHAGREWGRSGRPPQIAVLGPTQTGKSTVVNLLLGAVAAQVSPLAGFTVHPQGFLTGTEVPRGGWVDELFPGWPRVPPAQLARERLDAYALTAVAPPPSADLFAARPEWVIWDTPDFDSLAAREYARGVLETAALADVYLLVLSKEKYSDLSVWHLLELLEPLGRPLVVCLNKVTPDAEEPLTRSLRERLATRGAAWGEVPIITLPYVGAAGTEAACPALAPGQEELRAALRARVAGRDLRRGVAALLRQHWGRWLAPVQAQREAEQQWAEQVTAVAARFMETYTRDYLEHPERYDSFRRASLALLDLLELPRVGGFMGQVRRVTTWPARQLWALGRVWWQERQRQATGVHSLGAEATVLVDTLTAQLTGLQRDVLRRSAPNRPAAAYWQALEQRLSAEQERLQRDFEAAIHAHHERVSEEIRRTASQLFEELQQHPARLNALRTARATLDVGSIVLAVKTGGLTPLDAIWAPAAFALSSLLMEGIAGLEFSRVDRELRARQRAAVQGELVDKTLARALRELGAGLTGPGLFEVDEAGLAAATRELAAWEAGRE